MEIDTSWGEDAEIEYSICECPRIMAKEVWKIFSQVEQVSFLNERPKNQPDQNQLPPKFFIVPTFQKAKGQLLSMGSGVEDEKERLLIQFYCWSWNICKKLRHLGYWTDFTDPVSGFPVISKPGASFYPDVDGAQRLLKYPMIDIGNCHVLQHPRWGTNVYPGTLFTIAPYDLLLEALRSPKEIIPINVILEEVKQLTNR